LREVTVLVTLTTNGSLSCAEKVVGALQSGVPYFIVLQGNMHEIRGYNRLAMMARSELVAVIQDDDLPPVTPTW